MANNINVQPEATLTDLAHGYAPKGFIVPGLLPSISVGRLSGKIPNAGTSHLRLVSSVVFGKSKAPSIDITFSTDKSFEIEDHALENFVSRNDVDKWGDETSYKQIVNDSLSNALLLGREKAIADTLRSTSLITQNTTLVGDDQWDKTTSTVLDVLKVARKAIHSAVKGKANVAIMGSDVYDALICHPELMDALGFKFNRAGELNDVELARALRVEKVFVGDCYYESAKEGQTSSLASIWGNDFILAHIDYSPMNKTSKYLGASYKCPSKAPETYVQSYVPEGKTPQQGIILQQGRNYSDNLHFLTAAYLVKAAVGA